MPAPVVHFEIGFKSVERAKSFYGPLFGWTFEAYGPAAMISGIAGERSIGGHLNQLGHEPHNYCVVYAQVDSLKESIERAKSLGGKALVPPTEVPGMGSFAWISDPEGNTVGLWQVQKPA